jgi:hypothetical protein
MTSGKRERRKRIEVLEDFRKVCSLQHFGGVTYNSYGYGVFGTYPPESVMRAVISASKKYGNKIPLDLVDEIITNALIEDDYTEMRKRYPEDKIPAMFDKKYGFTKSTLFHINGRFISFDVSYESRIYIHSGEEREKKRISFYYGHRFLVPAPSPAPAIVPAPSWYETIKLFAEKTKEYVFSWAE